MGHRDYSQRNFFTDLNYLRRLLSEHKRKILLKKFVTDTAIKRGCKPDDVQEALDWMIDEGFVVQDAGWIILSKKPWYFEGTVKFIRADFAVVDLADGNLPEMILHHSDLPKYLHGDRVLVKFLRVDYDNNMHCSVVKFLGRDTQIIGTIKKKKRNPNAFEPLDARLRNKTFALSSEGLSYKTGDVVIAEITATGPIPSEPILLIAKERLGAVGDKDMEIEIAVRKFNVPYKFSDEALVEAKNQPLSVTKASLKNRVDLRDIPFVTIDGADARDFDDAVYCRKVARTGGYRLLVAIADVSYYVKPGSPLDKDAQERSTSIYFPTKVIPMLPEELSNGLCSLNPDVDRLTMVCDSTIDKSGNVTAYQFYPAVIHSAARLTYDSVWEALNDKKGPDAVSMKHVYPQITDLYNLFKILLKARNERGALDFDTVETYIVADEWGKIEQILPLYRNDAHRIIEEMMLVANTCAADFIRSNKATCLYRVHDKPKPDRLESARYLLSASGVHLGGGDNPTPEDYFKALEVIKTKINKDALQTILLRSMQRAEYSPDNKGHFGLAYSAYTHFTSPIRRYPDLLVHRTIKAILDGKKYKPELLVEVPVFDDRKPKAETKSATKELTVWRQLGQICSSHERRADEASSDVLAWLKCIYMEQFIGQNFFGTINTVTPYAVFVTLDDIYVEGSVHVSRMSDYFTYDETNNLLRGEYSGAVLNIGKKITVKVEACDIDNRRIELSIVSYRQKRKKDNQESV